MADPGWARRTAAGWALALHVQPGAKRSAAAGLHGERLKLRIAAPAVDGRANDALVAFVAERLGVPKGLRSGGARRAFARQAAGRDGECEPSRLAETD